MLIEYLKGTLKENQPGYSVLEVGGIGYGIETMPLDYSGYPALGSEILLYIHYHLHEDSRAYYGFLSRRDRDIFTLLLSVSGIGPKLACKAFAEHSASQLILWLRNGDDTKLRSVKGIGPKLAGKMVIDLKDKAAKFISPHEPLHNPGTSSQTTEIEMALQSLGYKEAEIQQVLLKLKPNLLEKSLEESIRLALQLLSKK